MTREKALKIRTKLESTAQHIPEIEAYEVLWMYPIWSTENTYTAGKIWQHADKLWRCRQNHKGQALYEPSINTAALWELIPLPNEEGTSNNPINYAPGMTLEEGKYYTQYNILYICIRDSISPVYHDLSALIGLYVEETF